MNHLLRELRIVVLIEDDTLDACLNDHLHTQEARERRRVNPAVHGLRSTCLNDSRLFSMQAFAFVEFLSLRDVSVASGASTLIAVEMSEWCAVVSCRHYTEVFYYDSTVASLHAV